LQSIQFCKGKVLSKGATMSDLATSKSTQDTIFHGKRLYAIIIAIISLLVGSSPLFVFCFRWWTLPPMDSVPLDLIEVEDGDTFVIHWPDTQPETVRILGIDTAEIQHEVPKMDDQPYGTEARGFFTGVLATTRTARITRCEQPDKYGRTLAYLYVDRRNYSELVVRARLAYESVSKYGDNGFPDEAALILSAYQDAIKEEPLPFENPSDFRARMREKYPVD
jgi:micrococcal nuclease